MLIIRPMLLALIGRVRYHKTPWIEATALLNHATLFAALVLAMATVAWMPSQPEANTAFRPGQLLKICRRDLLLLLLPLLQPTRKCLSSTAVSGLELGLFILHHVTKPV